MLRITEWPFEWFEQFPTLVSIGLALNIDSKLQPFTYASFKLCCINSALLLTLLVASLWLRPRFPNPCRSWHLVSRESLQRFPATLRHLHLNMVDSINDDLIPFLPQMLLTLSLDKNFRITNAGIARLPEWLETLYLPQNSKLTSQCIPKLPKTLRSLTFRTSDEITPELMAEMPALTTLNVHGSQRLTGPTIAALPSSITNFLWSIDVPMGLMELTSLPRSLNELYIRSLDTPLETIPHIPPAKRLTVVSTVPSGEYLVLTSLPQTLISLNLTSMRQFAPDIVTTFPPTLTSLTLQSLRKANKADIERLPRGLHILKLTNFAGFQDAWFSALPPQLHVFHCTWNELITDKLFSYAPPSLYRLVMRSMVVVDPVVRNGEAPRFVTHPIDDYISIAPLFPRIADEIRLKRGTAVHVPDWDTYSFNIDHGVLSVFDIFPRGFQRTASPTKADGAEEAKEPKSAISAWFSSLFS